MKLSSIPNQVYVVVKSFQGGGSIYYAVLPKNTVISERNMQRQLESWGENTDGGHCLGYEMYASLFNPKEDSDKDLPKSRRLYFDVDVLMSKGKKDKILCGTKVKNTSGASKKSMDKFLRDMDFIQHELSSSQNVGALKVDVMFLFNELREVVEKQQKEINELKQRVL